MPVYAYRCPAGHESTRLASFSARPEVVQCDDCGEWAKRTVTAPQASMGCTPPVKERPAVREIGTTLEERFMTCVACGADSYDVSESDAPLGPCPTCGGERRKRVHAARANVDTEEYPYFDQALGMVLTSARHKRDVLKQRGLFVIGNEEATIARSHEVERARIEKEEAAFQAYMARLNSAPEFRDFRRMQGDGTLDAIYDTNKPPDADKPFQVIERRS